MTGLEPMTACGQLQVGKWWGKVQVEWGKWWGGVSGGVG